MSDLTAAGPSDDPPRRRLNKFGALLPKVALELFVVFIGVTAAFAVEDYRDRRDEDERRAAVYRALDRELRQMAETHGPRFDRRMTAELNMWDQLLASGHRPVPPTFKLPGAEGPPTGAWQAAVATGSIELVDPELFYELARFYNRAETAGILYQRYSAAAQAEVWPRLNEGPKAFWTADGGLTPATKAHVQRLRDFRDRARANSAEASVLRSKLRRVLPD